MKKVLLFVAAMATFTFATVVSSCSNKDKEEVVSQCVCDYNVEGDMYSEVWNAGDLKSQGVSSCSALEASILNGYGAVQMTVHCR